MWEEDRTQNIQDPDLIRALKEPIDIAELAEQLNKKVFDTGVAAERARVLALVQKRMDDTTTAWMWVHLDILRAAIESGEQPVDSGTEAK